MVQRSEATQVPSLTVLLQSWLEHRDGNAEVQVWVGGPSVVVPSVAGNDACWGESKEEMKQEMGCPWCREDLRLEGDLGALSGFGNPKCGVLDFSYTFLFLISPPSPSMLSPSQHNGLAHLIIFLSYHKGQDSGCSHSLWNHQMNQTGKKNEPDSHGFGPLCWLALCHTLAQIFLEKRASTEKISYHIGLWWIFLSDVRGPSPGWVVSALGWWSWVL